MNDAKSSAAAGRKIPGVNGAPGAGGTGASTACHHGGGKVRVVEREAGHDDHAAQEKGEEHQRHDQPFVERDTADVEGHGQPQHAQRNGQADRARVQR